MNDEHDTSSGYIPCVEDDCPVCAEDLRQQASPPDLMRQMVDRQMAPTLQDIEDITVKHTRAEIAGNPKDFITEVLVIELRAIAGQQLQIGTTNKLRTHFDKISGELRRRGLNNNGRPFGA